MLVVPVVAVVGVGVVLLVVVGVLVVDVSVWFLFRILSFCDRGR